MSNPADRRKHWRKIPDSTDILVTHGPPYGVLDTAPGSTLHEGCPELFEAVRLIEPRLHVFGHIHGAYGVVHTADTIFRERCTHWGGGRFGTGFQLCSN